MHPLQLCAVELPAFCLQLVTLVQVSVQLPSPHDCVSDAEPEPDPVHEPSAQFCVHVAPFPHDIPQLPSPQLRMHVELSPHATVQLSSVAHANVHVPPVSHAHGCPLEQLLSFPLMPPPVVVLPPSVVTPVPPPPPPGLVVLLLLHAVAKTAEIAANAKKTFFKVASDTHMLRDI